MGSIPRLVGDLFHTYLERLWLAVVHVRVSVCARACMHVCVHQTCILKTLCPWTAGQGAPEETWAAGSPRRPVGPLHMCVLVCVCTCVSSCVCVCVCARSRVCGEGYGRQGESLWVSNWRHHFNTDSLSSSFSLFWTINITVTSLRPSLLIIQTNAQRIAQVLQRKLLLDSLRQTYLPH